MRAVLLCGQLERPMAVVLGTMAEGEVGLGRKRCVSGRKDGLSNCHRGLISPLRHVHMVQLKLTCRDAGWPNFGLH